METSLEHVLTNAYKADMISYIKSHPENFNEAVQLSLSDKQPYSRRAAWLLWSCMDQNDKRLQKYIKKIIDTLPNTRDDQLREFLIILYKMKINDEDEGALYDICVNTWKTVGKKPSVRYHAFKHIVKVAKKHPDLWKEINLLTQTKYMDTLSETVKKSIFKMMDRFQKI